MVLNPFTNHLVFGGSKSSSQRSSINILGQQLFGEKKTCPFETFEFRVSNGRNARKLRIQERKGVLQNATETKTNVKNVCGMRLFVRIISKLFYGGFFSRKLMTNVY